MNENKIEYYEGQLTIYLKVKEGEELNWHRFDIKPDFKVENNCIKDIRILKTELLPDGEVPEWLNAGE